MPTLVTDISILGNGINFKTLLSERVTLSVYAHTKVFGKCCVGKSYCVGKNQFFQQNKSFRTKLVANKSYYIMTHNILIISYES